MNEKIFFLLWFLKLSKENIDKINEEIKLKNFQNRRVKWYTMVQRQKKQD